MTNILRTYRMVIIKNEKNKMPGATPGIIRGNRFIIEVMPQRTNCFDKLLCKPADILVIDLCVNPQQGLDIIREMRIHNLKTEVIAYISQDDAGTLKSAIRLGVVDCITQPFETERFNHAVEKAVFRMENAKGAVEQDMVDKLIYSNAASSNMLPKGLHKDTLNKIRAAFSSNPDESFSCEDIVEAVNLSRITVQRYITYLNQMEELTQDLKYETGGRPRSLYQYNISAFA